jgi:hypothetical protein
MILSYKQTETNCRRVACRRCATSILAKTAIVDSYCAGMPCKQAHKAEVRRAVLPVINTCAGHASFHAMKT